MTCENHRPEITLIVLRCPNCGEIEQKHIESAGNLFAERARSVHKGLIRADVVTQMDGLTDEEKQQLLAIVPCAHEAGKWVTCCGGKQKWECAGCGRRFLDRPEGAKEIDHVG